METHIVKLTAFCKTLSKHLTLVHKTTLLAFHYQLNGKEIHIVVPEQVLHFMEEKNPECAEFECGTLIPLEGYTDCYTSKCFFVEVTEEPEILKDLCLN